MLAYSVVEWVRVRAVILIWMQVPLVETHLLLSRSIYEGFGPFLKCFSDNRFQHGIFNLYIYMDFAHFSAPFQLLFNKCLHFQIDSLKLNSAVVDYFLIPEAFSYLNTLQLLLRNSNCFSVCSEVHHLSSVLYLCREAMT